MSNGNAYNQQQQQQPSPSQVKRVEQSKDEEKNVEDVVDPTSVPDDENSTTTSIPPQMASSVMEVEKEIETGANASSSN